VSLDKNLATKTEKENKMLHKKYNKFVSEATLESGFDLQIYLKEPYVFGNDASCTFFAFEDYDTMKELWAAANKCCAEEIIKDEEHHKDLITLEMVNKSLGRNYANGHLDNT
tara:strand:- start:24 stop:359 length:336 start_codon:yes stop_codon:yes gene_type:complete